MPRFFIYVFLFTHCEERNLILGGELFCKKEESNQSNLCITYSFCLENGVMMIPKRRLLTSIFACLCFKKEEEEHLEHKSSRFEVQKNCTPKLLNFRP